jgi:hypothetical protein
MEHKKQKIEEATEAGWRCPQGSSFGLGRDTNPNEEKWMVKRQEQRLLRAKLFFCCETGDAAGISEILEEALFEDLDKERPAPRCDTFLGHAIRSGNPEAVKILLERAGPKTNFEGLLWVLASDTFGDLSRASEIGALLVSHPLCRISPLEEDNHLVTAVGFRGTAFIRALGDHQKSFLGRFSEEDVRNVLHGCCGPLEP